MILHSVDFGAAVAEALFPDHGDVARIVRLHVVEDLGNERTLSEWLALCRRAQLPSLYPGTLPIDGEQMVANEVYRCRLRSDDAVRQVWTMLTLPLIFAPEFGPGALCILGNSFGPALIRRVVGPPREIDGTLFDPALCAERLIHDLFRAVPPMLSVVCSLKSNPLHRVNS